MATYSDSFPSTGNLAAPWGIVSGEVNWTVSSANHCLPTGGLGSDAAVYYDNTTGQDQFSQFTLVAFSGGSSGVDAGGGPAVRVSKVARTYYRILVNAAATNNTFIAKFVAGGYSILNTSTVAWAVNDVIMVTATGGATTVITVWKNGVSSASYSDSSSPITSGLAGMDYSSTISAFTVGTWSGGDYGGGGGARPLFRTPPMNGMGVGGSFFRDPLSAPMQMVRRDRIFVPAWLGEAA